MCIRFPILIRHIFFILITLAFCHGLLQNLFGQSQEPIIRFTYKMTNTYNPIEWDSPTFRPRGTILRVVIKISPTLTPPTYKMYIYSEFFYIISRDGVYLARVKEREDKTWMFQNGQYVEEFNMVLSATGVECFLTLYISYSFGDIRGENVHAANFEMEVYDMYSPKARTTLSLTVPPSVHVGDSMTLSGSISPSFSGAQIIINIVGPESRTLYAATKDGQFSASYTPPKVGKYSVEAIFNGDSEHEASRSSAVSFEATKMPTSLTLSVSPAEGSIDVLTKSVTELSITGRIEPGIQTSIQVDIWQPDDRKITKIIQTSTDGKFSMSFTPTALGPYTIEARFQGDEQYESSSNQVIVYVRVSYNTVILAGVVLALIVLMGAYLKRRAKSVFPPPPPPS